MTADPAEPQDDPKGSEPMLQQPRDEKNERYPDVEWLVKAHLARANSPHIGTNHELHASTAAALRSLQARLSKAEGERDETQTTLRDGWISGDKRVAPVMLEKCMGQSFLWLVWAIKPGAVRLLAVCSDERHADHYAANMPPGLSEFKAWKEQAPLDHGFGFADSLHARAQGKL